ncbi:MAG: YihY/virulence factor BrkB family protein [Pyrinomonadaceae bacterium]|nr:YihY/virulence factor BrkB family protein [Pyrinomonadaceae bacterium]MCX7639297.1 YihY/virulence factor BrkB family protein [Pyrinomonadaceae bacterium]MDW8303481.1 YihY/virulence factor BrkB family protein [Acidobacteriota bacterium]
MQKWKGFFVAVYNKSFEDEIFGRAAEIAFYFLFSIFPLLLFLTTLFGLALKNSDELQTQLFSYLKQVMPGSAYELLQKALHEAIQESSGSKITLGLIMILWSASAGFESLSNALNKIYAVEETRFWWQVKLNAIFLVLAVSLLVLVGITLNLFVSNLISGLFGKTIAEVLSSFIILTLLFSIFELVDNFCPNFSRKQRRFFSWGAVVSILLWLLVSSAFSFYLRFFGNYARVYGSLGAVIILVFWFYLSALVILIGAEVNSLYRSKLKNVFNASGNN